MDPKNIDRAAKAGFAAVIVAGGYAIKKSLPFLKQAGKIAIKIIFKRRR